MNWPLLVTIVLMALGALIVAGLPAFIAVWPEIWNMPQGIGALFGSFFGLLSVAGAGLIAYYANKRRDEQTRQSEALAVAGAIHGELSSILLNTVALVRMLQDQERRGASALIVVAEITSNRETPFFNMLRGDIRHLPPSVAKDIAHAYALIQISEGMSRRILASERNIRDGAERQIVGLEADMVVALTPVTRAITEAIDTLAKFGGFERSEDLDLRD